MKAQRLLTVPVLLAVFAAGVIFSSMFRASTVYGRSSPGEGKIAFSTNRDGNDEIYAMNPDGSGQINLTNNPANDEEPAWSPDGTSIAFASDRDGNYEICVMNADGSNQRCLTNNRTANGQPDKSLPEDRYPAWSPDGTQITFMSTRDGNTEIYRMDADGKNVVNLTNNPAGDVFPDWQPVGGTALVTPPPITNPGGFQATDIKIGVNPPSYTGACPTTFTFTAQIFAQGTGNITYRWERSDGAISQVGTALIGASGSATVSTTWQLGVSGTFWEAVHVLTPNDVVSAKASFTLNCGAPPPVAGKVIGIKTGVTPKDYKDVCPTKFIFTGAIITDGPATVTYRWERSDGATSPVQTLNFGAAGTQTVQTTWQLGGSGMTFSGWEVIHVLTPNNMYSEKLPTAFNLICTN